MDYYLNHKQKNPLILNQILQTRFPTFDDSVIKWKYREKPINSKFLEKKIIDTFKNKKEDTLKKSNNYLEWINIFDKEINKLKSINKLPVLFFSGGKDSFFIASRLVENKIDALYFAFARNNIEKKLMTDLGNILNIKIFFTEKDLKYLDFDQILKKIKEPVLDPAGLSVLLLLDIAYKNKYKLSDLVFLDGMGNGPYMGILPGKREISKMFYQKLFTKLLMHKILPYRLWNSIGRYGDLFRPSYAADIPGSTIKLRNYYKDISFYERYNKLNDPVLERALIRGLHYGFCSAMNKSTIYLDACDKDSKMIFPFLNDDLFDFFEKQNSRQYDYPKLVDKLSMRNYLNSKYSYNKIYDTKGIFHPTFLNFKFDNKQNDLAKKLNINTDQLNQFQKSDYYLWSKYIINNEIEVMNS